MAVGVKVKSQLWPIGTSDFLHAFFSTISCHLEPDGWGTRFPTLVTMSEPTPSALFRPENELREALPAAARDGNRTSWSCRSSSAGVRYVPRRRLARGCAARAQPGGRLGVSIPAEEVARLRTLPAGPPEPWLLVGELPLAGREHVDVEIASRQASAGARCDPPQASPVACPPRRHSRWRENRTTVVQNW